MKNLPSSLTDVIKMPYEIHSFGLSHQGYVRARNEDAWAHLPKEHFYVLADGMGGRNGGAVAATEALRVLCEGVKNHPVFKEDNPSIKEASKTIVELTQKANLHVWEKAESDVTLEGMGTTLCSLCILKKSCIVANIGDSRIYRYHQNILEQLTQDDSLLADLLKFNLVDQAEAKTFPLKHVITKSIGAFPEVEPTLELLEVEKGDIFLLCSDGLTNSISDETIERILSKMQHIQDGAEKLVKAALDAGGLDNITVVLVQIS